MAVEADFSRVKLQNKEVTNYMDSRLLAEKRLPNLSKIDLSGLQQPSALKAMSDAHNEMVEYLKQIGAIVQSTQECLLNLCLKMDALRATEKENPPGNGRAHIWQEERTKKILCALRGAINEYPEHQDNLPVIAAFAGTTVQTLKKYRAQNLI